MIDDLIADLRRLSDEELREIKRVIDVYSMDNTRERLHYYGRFLGIRWIDNGQTVMELGPFNENTYNVAQGGALYTLADIAIGFEILKTLGLGQRVMTLEMKMNFLKPGTGSILLSRVEFLHWGSRTVVAQCSIVDERDVVVAHALGTFYVS